VAAVTTPAPTSEGPPTKPWSGGGRDELAAAVRRLMALTVAAAAPPEVLAGAAARMAALSEELEMYIAESGSVPRARFSDESSDPGQPLTLAARMPFDMIIGTCNPVALPIAIELRPPRAIGEATFTAPYEGAPGCVHGAALAAAFDMMLTAANSIADAAGPTVELTLRYLKPTVISRPTTFEAWVTRIEGDRTHSMGQLTQNGVVTVEAVGEFVRMERSRIASMHRSNQRAAPVGTPDDR
jgi:acyl-coenzyme A thioesterase PaaI-like protein